MSFFDFFFNDTATTEIYTLSLHDALPIYTHSQTKTERIAKLYPLGHVTIVDIIVIFHHGLPAHGGQNLDGVIEFRSEEHTSELQSANISYAVFCLKKKKNYKTTIHNHI